MDDIAMFVKLPLHEGSFDKFKAFFEEVMVPQVANEPGTTNYVLCQDPNEPDVARLYETYTDKAALDAHSGSDAMAKFIGAMGDYVAGAPEMVSTKIVTEG